MMSSIAQVQVCPFLQRGNVERSHLAGVPDRSQVSDRAATMALLKHSESLKIAHKSLHYTGLPSYVNGKIKILTSIKEAFFVYHALIVLMPAIIEKEMID